MLAAQLYTVRDYTRTADDIAKTLKRIKTIGYPAVQISALGPVEPAELAKMLKNEGLICCASHVALDQLEKEPRRVIDNHHLYGCELVAIGGLFRDRFTAGDWDEFADHYTTLAGQFAAADIQLGYHNHSHELAHYQGRTALSRLIQRTRPPVWFEIDTYWITHGGGDPASWIAAVAGRIPAVHLKDMSVSNDRQQRMAVVGEGNLNWPAIFAACRDAQVRYYIVEQDDCYGEDPFDCLKRSYEFLSGQNIGQ